jgi:hypothetical protein
MTLTTATVAQAAADEMLRDLHAHRDQLDYLRAPHADFVYVEEGLCTLLAAAPYDNVLYLTAFGKVVHALEMQHGILPPLWFLRATGRA